MTIDYLQAVVLGLLQGVAELFPVSSLGHSVVLPQLLGWDIQQDDDAFLTFLVATHLATALVLVGFFRRDWVRIVARPRPQHPRPPHRRCGRPPRVAAGRGDDPGRHPRAAARGRAALALRLGLSASIFLMVNGAMLLGAEALRRRAPQPEAGDADARIARQLSWRGAAGVGSAQALGLIPGISRSGAAMSGGLLAGLSNEDSARFAFLLATPIIGAAGALKLPELLGPSGNGVRGPALVGGLCAAGAAYLSVRFLMRYFETNRLTPFGVYCLVAGAALTGYFAV